MTRDFPGIAGLVLIGLFIVGMVYHELATREDVVRQHDWEALLDATNHP